MTILQHIKLRDSIFFPTGGKDSKTSLGSRRQPGGVLWCTVSFGVSPFDFMLYPLTLCVQALSSVWKTSKYPSCPALKKQD